MILFGFRGIRRHLGTTFIVCSRCQRPCSHVVARVQRWFTLFFIPVAPIKTTYFTVCSMCSAAVKVDRAQAEHLVAVGREQASSPVEMTPDGPMTPPPTAGLGFGPPEDVTPLQ